MIFAELDSNGWVAIIGAISVIVLQVVKMVLDFFREARMKVIVQETVNQAKGEVKATMHQVTDDQNDKLDTIAKTTESTNLIAGQIKQQTKDGGP